jgi:hypothetical protein
MEKTTENKILREDRIKNFPVSVAENAVSLAFEGLHMTHCVFLQVFSDLFF